MKTHFPVEITVLPHSMDLIEDSVSLNQFFAGWDWMLTAVQLFQMAERSGVK